MKKIRCVCAGVLAAMLCVEVLPLQQIQAATLRELETKELYDTAVSDMDTEAYVHGEALISFEAMENDPLAIEGSYRYDSAVEIERVSCFGTNEETGKQRYIALLSSDKYTTEQLMELSLERYYVDKVSANGYEELTSLDPYADAQWYLDGTGASYDSEGIRYSLEPELNLKDTPVIAVLDTGVDYTHPDLASVMWKNPYPNELKGTYGYDCADNDADPMDHSGHGTHVAGIAAAASNNNIGIAGVADAQIMAVKVTTDDSEDITDDAIIAGYEYVFDAQTAGVNICAVNCSWGGSQDTNGIVSLAIDLVGEMGALSVFAAGNEGVDWDSTNQALQTPYDLESPYVVIVGASAEDDSAAYYSDYSASQVDLFAPGNTMLSTYSEECFLPGAYDDATRTRLTTYFNRLSESADNILPAGQTFENYYIAEQLGIETSYLVEPKLASDGSNQYLEIDVTLIGRNNRGEVAGSIYADVTDLYLDQNATYYVSVLLGDTEGTDICWDSNMFVSTPEQSRFVEIGGRTYMRITGLWIDQKSAGETLKLYLDDLAISKANVEKSELGKYAYLTGSSMSAPVVSGAIATLAAANPTLSARALRAKLMKCVRVVDALSDKCVTSGIIDLSKLKNYVTKVKLSKRTATLSAGATIKLRASVTPTYATNAKVKWTTSNKRYATVNANGLVRIKKTGIGHTVKITATSLDGSNKKAVCKIKIKR